MQQRRSLHIYRRCCLAVFIASTSTLAGSATISAAEPEVPPMLRIPAERTGTYVHENPPLNSTLKIRIARRPWLLEKLKTPSPKPSIKMTPPRPPAAIPDPPSMSLVVPENGSGWVTRGRVKTQVPHYADLKVEPEQTSSQAVASEDLNADKQIPQTKLQSVSQGTSTEPSDSTPTSGSAEAGVIDTPEPTMSARTSDDDVSDNTATEDSRSQFRPDVSEKSTQPNVAKKSKLELKGTDPDTSQTQIGEKSTATLKGNAVIVGDDDASSEDKTGGGQRTSNVDLTGKGGSPEPGTIPAETSEQTTKDSPTDSDMAASPSQASPEADSSVTEDKQTEPKPKATDEVKAEESDKSGTVDEQNEATEPDSDAVSKKDDVVKVRKLRLQADGTVSDKTGLAESETASLKAEEEAKKEPTSQFVSSENPSATKIDYTGRPAEPIELTRSVSRMRNTIRQGLLYHYARPETANERSNWGMLHSIMVFGADTKIRVNNRKYSAIAWIAGNNACRGQRLLTTKNDAITARSGVGLQGHQAQLLAVFSLCNVPLDYPVYASEEKFSIRDIVESEMLACRSGEELTFSLIGLSHYLDTDTIWLNADGETWSFERLIKEELSQPIVG
ncbi:MAG: hypothetical protein ACPGPS_21495, partial [Rubripirellula sp.]